METNHYSEQGVKEPDVIEIIKKAMMEPEISILFLQSIEGFVKEGVTYKSLYKNVVSDYENVVNELSVAVRILRENQLEDIWRENLWKQKEWSGGSKMKIDLVELKINGEKSYKYKPFKYCCTKMRDNPYIDFTNENVSSENGNFGGSHIPQFCVWEDAFERVDNFFINFCPFCGEKIEVSVVEEKDISDTYKKLEEKKNFFEEEIWNIDRQIAELYKVSEYPEVDSLCISKKNFCI